MIRHGIGFASAWQGVNYHFGHPDTSSARLELMPNLHYRLGVSAADLGEGIPETNTVILSQTLGGIPAEAIEFVDADTRATPDSGTTGASRQTAMTGNAVLSAARHMEQLLKSIAGELIDTAVEQVALRLGVFYGSGKRSTTLAEVVQEAARIGQPLSVLGTFRAPPTEDLDTQGQGLGVNQFSYATYVAEVDVDTDTGEVVVRRVAAFVDAGRIVRRLGAEMQIEGGVAMGLGHTLTEELLQRQGEPMNDGLATYLIPTARDVPHEVTSEFTDMDIPFGDLGAKGMAELALVPVAPAIISAIHNAVGVSLTQLPASPERVLAALHMSAAGDG